MTQDMHRRGRGGSERWVADCTDQRRTNQSQWAIITDSEGVRRGRGGRERERETRRVDRRGEEEVKESKRGEERG